MSALVEVPCAACGQRAALATREELDSSLPGIWLCGNCKLPAVAEAIGEAQVPGAGERRLAEARGCFDPDALPQKLMQD